MDRFSHPKFDRAAELFAEACRLSRDHNKATQDALASYGDHGPQISGVIRDHFPDDIKKHLRLLCFLITDSSNAAWQARPKYVRNGTMLALSRMIAARDGSGFYGPRP